jgi:hypothetical protein
MLGYIPFNIQCIWYISFIGHIPCRTPLIGYKSSIGYISFIGYIPCNIPYTLYMVYYMVYTLLMVFYMVYILLMVFYIVYIILMVETTKKARGGRIKKVNKKRSILNFWAKRGIK